jgi:hypothetical protein
MGKSAQALVRRCLIEAINTPSVFLGDFHFVDIQLPHTAL